MLLILCGASLAGAAFREEQFWLQLLQSWVHSLIVIHISFWENHADRYLPQQSRGGLS